MVMNFVMIKFLYTNGILLLQHDGILVLEVWQIYGYRIILQNGILLWNSASVM